MLLGNHCFSGVISGDYGEAGTLEFLKDFHKRRLEVLAEAGPDLIAFETIPNKLEAQVTIPNQGYFASHLTMCSYKIISIVSLAGL